MTEDIAALVGFAALCGVAVGLFIAFVIAAIVDRWFD